MTNPAEQSPQPPIPSLEDFRAALAINNMVRAHEVGILMLESHFDRHLAEHPEDWIPQGPHTMLLRQRSTRPSDAHATAGSVVEVIDAPDALREYRVSAYRTSSGGISLSLTGLWCKGDSCITQVKADDESFPMPSDPLEFTVVGAHPDTSEIVRPTGFRAFVRRLGLVGIRTLTQSQSRHPGMTRPFDA